jgi:flagellar motor switch/type III secretory pathway protein FliN
LIEAAGKVVKFHPPPVEQLTAEECRLLRATLGEVLGSWQGAAEIGLRVTEVRRCDEASAMAQPGGVCFSAATPSVHLCLSPEGAACLLCVILGAPIPETPQTRLSGIDRALLHAWAQRALPELAGALGAGPAGEVLRTTRPPHGRGPAVLVEMQSAGQSHAGFIVLPVELVRRREVADGGTLGDHPHLLHQAHLQLRATIPTEAVPLRDLLALESGDVLLLGSKAAVRAELTAGSSVIAKGRPGARAGMRAVRLKGGALTDGDDRSGETSDGF